MQKFGVRSTRLRCTHSMSCSLISRFMQMHARCTRVQFLLPSQHGRNLTLLRRVMTCGTVIDSARLKNGSLSLFCCHETCNKYSWILCQIFNKKKTKKKNCWRKIRTKQILCDTKELATLLKVMSTSVKILPIFEIWYP